MQIHRLQAKQEEQTKKRIPDKSARVRLQGMSEVVPDLPVPQSILATLPDLDQQCQEIQLTRYKLLQRTQMMMMMSKLVERKGGSTSCPLVRGAGSNRVV